MALYPNVRHTNYTVPNFYILGAAKCGTTSLAKWLGRHPDICISRPKEPRYFTMEYHNGPEWYSKNYFPHYDGEYYMGDASALNLMVHFVTKRIKETSGSNAKFIVLVRNPIQRAYSFWSKYSRMRPGRETGTFDEVILENFRLLDDNIFETEEEFMVTADAKGGSYRPTYIEHGMYATHIKRFQAEFGLESVGVWTLDQLSENPKLTMNEVYKFLGVKNWCLDMSLEEENWSSAKRTTELPLDTMHTTTYNDLQRFYQPGVEELSNMFGINFLEQWGFK
jgi:hypothetical protein